LAIVSLIALLAALALTALATLHPWSSPTSVAPQLSLGQGLGVGLGDAVALPPARSLAVAPARPVAPGAQRLVASEARDAPSAATAVAGVAPARVVSAPTAPSAAPPTPSAPEPESAPPPQASPPAPVPVAAPAPQPEPIATSPARPTLGGGTHPDGPAAAGGPPVYGAAGEPIDVAEGDELAFSFLFYIEPIAYRSPGDENTILQLRGEPGTSPRLGLQLWDDGGEQRGLWSSGEAMGGERFLAPLGDDEWHQAVVFLRASSGDDGFYLLLLDGKPIDTRGWVSLLESAGAAQLEAGLFREGERVAAPLDLFFGPTRLGESLESVLG
jgi:hypothetical protein